MDGNIPNFDIARISSSDAAAIIIPLIPFSAPYPWFCSRIHAGTTTAGDTADIILPAANARAQFIGYINVIIRPAILDSTN